MDVYLELNLREEIDGFKITKIPETGKVLVLRFKIIDEDSIKEYKNGYIFDSSSVFYKFLRLYIDSLDDYIIEYAISLRDSVTKEVFCTEFDNSCEFTDETFKKLDEFVCLSSCISKYNRLELRSICEPFIDDSDLNRFSSNYRLDRQR